MYTFENIENQISFVSHQTLPVILGALKYKPKCLHLITNDEMKKQTEWLTSYLQKHHFKVQKYNLQSGRQKELSHVLTQIKNEHNGNISLNITNGTKLYTIEASEWTFTNPLPTFYVDTKNEEIVFPGIGEDWHYEELPDLLKYDDIFESNGFQIKNHNNSPISQDLRNLTEKLLKLFSKNPQLLSQFNAIVASTKGFMAENKYPSSEALKEVFEVCKDAGLLALRDDTIIFNTEENIKWCNGLWFEDYVSSIIYKLKQEKLISSWASSVDLDKEGSPNEIDVLFTAKNRLFAIECKTSKMDEKKHQSISGEEKSTSYIYKIDSLKEKLGGNLTKSILCSVAPFQKYDIDRAKRDKIILVTGKDLLNLENEVRNWIAK